MPSTRAKGNILFLRHVWLDIENGDLKPTEFPHLFPYTRMVVTNTFRHTSKKPRFRVIIPTSQIMTIEGYGVIYDGIAAKLEDATRPFGSRTAAISSSLSPMIRCGRTRRV
jgi:hypothetical protein